MGKIRFVTEGPDGVRSVNISEALRAAARAAAKTGQSKDVNPIPPEEVKRRLEAKGFKVQLPETRGSPLDPDKEIERAKRILEPQTPDLTVGDISVVTAERRRAKKRRLKGVDANDPHFSLPNLYLGPEPIEGDLYVGPKSSDVKPHVSESQKLASAHMEKVRRKRRLIWEIQNEIARLQRRRKGS